MEHSSREDVPITMVITAPIMVRRPRGIRAKELRSRLDTRFKVLFDSKEKALIQEEADQLGIAMAEFIRHCALQSARYLRKYREDYESEREEVNDTASR